VNLSRRLAKLESAGVLQRDLRAVIRFEGPGSETFDVPTDEEIAGASHVITVCFVQARDGKRWYPEPMSKVSEQV
jgi:hypothetical protein